MKKKQIIRHFCTAKNSQLRISELQSIAFSDNRKNSLPGIILDEQKSFQIIEGFGGAFTEAAASTFYKMPTQIQNEILNAYFNVKIGHGYSICRTHINSCDFSLGNYAYTEVAGDVNLEHFSIERDRRALIPLIKAAMLTSETGFKLFASPWSPPAWMKTNGKMNEGGKLKPEYRDAWAKYYARYIKEYEKENIPIWGITVQNEPAAVQSWDSCIYSAEEERDFVRDYLGPVMHQNNLSNVKIIVWDHNRDLMYERAKTVYDDPEASKYVWGTGFHWYCNGNYENLQKLHDEFPDKKLLFTEGCVEGGTHSGSWNAGERYAHSIINDLNKWCVGWVDWNIILDETGGPNHVGNFCSAPIIANTKTGELHYQSSFFYIGHFARFIRPGSKRIFCNVNCDDLETTAFQNPDGSIAVVVLNRTDKDIDFVLDLNGKHAETNSLSHSINTFCIKEEIINK